MSIAIGAGILLWGIGSSAPSRTDLVTSAWVVSLTLLLSLSTTFIMPSGTIPDTIIVTLISALLLAAYAPLLIASWLASHRGRARQARARAVRDRI
jgi:preprotein translocase subunit SecF